jgi:hypothetical protein
MRALRVAAFVAAAMAPATIASAQMTGYICTPDGQVLKQTINPNGTSGGTTLLYTGNKNQEFGVCELFPDGWLYIASASSIIRIDPNQQTPSGGAAVVALFPSPVRGIGINVTTLYVNTATSGIYTLKAVAGATDPFTFPDLPVPFVTSSPTDGHGVVFDIIGNNVLAAGSDVLKALVNSAAPFYTTAPSPVETRTNTVFDVAVNTCGQIVYADRATRSVRRLAKDAQTSSPLESFADPADYPVAIRIDAYNNIDVLTVQSDAGDKGKYWRLSGSLANDCAAAPPSVVVDLSTLVSGTTKLKGLLSDRALGIALAPTDASLTRSFSAGQCSQLFDFGYYTLRNDFTDCSVPFTVTAAAMMSKPTEVNFSAALGTDLEGVRFSPLKGHIPQIALTRNGGPVGPLPSTAQYSLYTQEVFGTPGIARATSHDRTAPYTEAVLHDFVDVGGFDPIFGEKGNEFSKRVVYNAPLQATSLECTITPDSWGEPFNTQNPLFKRVQSIVISFIGRTATGEPCGGGGTMRISIARISPGPVQLMETVAVNGTDNIMSNQGDKYSILVDARLLGVGTFILTASGTPLAPASRIFTIAQ